MIQSTKRSNRLNVKSGTRRRAVIYLRKSSSQQEASIPRQRQECLAYASLHGYDIVHEYVDAGISGVDSVDKRPGFRQLVLDAKAGKFDFVIVWNMSRVSRSDPMQTCAELQPLRETGVRIATTDKPEPRDWDSFSGQIQEFVEFGCNNDYSAKLAMGTTSGQLKFAQEGNFVNGKPPFGYRRSERRDQHGKQIASPLELGDPDEIKIVKWMFKFYASGGSLRDIVAELKRKGQRRGVSWVRYVLANPCYAGDAVWNRKSSGKHRGIRNGTSTTKFKRGFLTQEDWVIVKNAHPAIVDRKLFDRVQSMFSDRRRASTPLKGGGGFVLSGLLRCADCGYAMTGTKSGSGRFAYRCGGFHQHGTDCHLHYCHQDEILREVLASLKERFADPDTIDKLRSEIRRQVKERQTRTNTKSLEAKLKKERATLKKYNERLLILEPGDLAGVRDIIADKACEVMNLERELKEATRTMPQAMADFDGRVERAMQAFEHLEQLVYGNDPAALRQWLRDTIKEIRIDVEQRPAGKRFKYALKSGEIFLHDTGNLSNLW